MVSHTLDYLSLVGTRHDCCDRGLHDMSSSSEAPVAGNFVYLGLPFMSGAVVICWGLDRLGVYVLL